MGRKMEIRTTGRPDLTNPLTLKLLKQLSATGKEAKKGKEASIGLQK